MRKFRKSLAIFLATLIALSSMLIGTVSAAVRAPSISMELDKTTAEVGDVIKVSVKVNEIAAFATAYQLNLKYDPAVLQAVNYNTKAAFANNTRPLDGDIFLEPDVAAASNDIAKGILNFGKTFTSSRPAEPTGTLAIIGFKVLQKVSTNITFANTPTMPNGINGTLLFSQPGSPSITGYSVIQPPQINGSNISPSAKPTNTPTVKPTNTPSIKPTNTPSTKPTNTPSIKPTNTPSTKPTNTPSIKPTNTPTVDPSGSYITIELDKTTASVGQIITASVKVNNIAALASAYQLNIKYDPAVLQAVNPTTGAAYTNTTKPSNGTIFLDADVVTAANDISKGILNFGKSFTAERAPEPTGTLAVIGFKVLQQTATTVKFADTTTMPNSIDGTLLFSKPGSPSIKGYAVKQPPSINGTVVVTPTPTNTPTPTSTATPTATKKPSTPTPTNTPTPTPTGNPGGSYITIELDKTTAAVGQIITASVKVNNIAELASAYQLNIKYDPAVLQAVNPTTGAAYTNTTKPSNGTIFLDADVVTAANDISKGILNFGKSFTADRAPEPTGTLAVIGFKVLQQTATTVKFADTTTMPNSIDGTLLFSKPGSPSIKGYAVKQPPSINGTVVVTPSSTPTPTGTPTPSNTPTPTPTGNPGGSYITIELDKTNAAVGQIITASVKVNNIIGLASAYQLNITYDPTVLQAVNPTTGAAYTNTTKPSNGNIFLDADVVAAAHDISKGILNFGKSFTAERPSEPTGTLAVIGFKVLKQTATTVKFEKSLTMPNSIDGTLLYSKPGTPNLTGYTVKQPPSINGTVVVTPTPTTTTKPTNTPTPTTTTKPTNTPTPTPDNNVKAWAPYTNYTTGTLVTYAGSKYQCVQSHQSLPGWEPANVPALWRKVTAR